MRSYSYTPDDPLILRIPRRRIDGFCACTQPTRLELTQADASLTLFWAVLSPLVARSASVLDQRARTAGKACRGAPSIAHFLKHPRLRRHCGRPFGSATPRSELGFRIVGRAFLPEGPRFQHLSPLPRRAAAFDEQLLSAFGTLGTTEQAVTSRACTSTTSPTFGESASTTLESRAMGERLAQAPRRSNRCTRR